MLPVVFEADSEALLGVLLTYGSRRGSGGLRPSLIKSIVIGQFAEATSRDRDFLVNCAPASAVSPTKKRLRKNRSLCSPTVCVKTAICFAQRPEDLARALGRPRQQALQGPEDLLGEFAVEFANLLRLRQKGLVSLLCEFGLNLDRLVERAHPRQ